MESEPKAKQSRSARAPIGWRQSVRARLTLSHLAAILAAMILSGFLLLSFLDRYFLQAVEDSLVAQAQITAQTLIPGARTIAEAPAQALIPGARTIAEAPAQEAASNTIRQQRTGNYYLQAENVAPPASGVPLGDLGDASLELGAALDTRIRVLDATGIVLVDSAGEERGSDLRADPVVAEALAGRYARRTESNAMVVAVPVTVEGGLAGVILLSQPLDDVRAVLRDVRLRWGLSMAAALLLSGAAGWFLSDAIARPVRRLIGAAGAVARGTLDQQVPVRSRDELGRLSAAFNDMTARLRAARQMQTDFVANVSHELRTPLTSIKGLVETLRDGAVDDRRVRDRFLETIEGETNRLIAMVNDLLFLSRVDSDVLRVQREPVDVGDLAQAAAEQVALLAEARTLDLRVEVQPGTPAAWGDVDRITQVVLNLLDNAVKFSAPGGTIRVQVDAVQADAPWVRVRVRDRGIGIPAKDLPRIGERFYRADRARSRAQGGSGLGLAIARALVEAQGGRLAIESAEGEGTTVTFTLPAAP
ncbi:MAG: HAMP domain-containing protein [Anaerolineae bacterium]|nr:HAMP domain-containing protein [Anaerolineae bacterium]